MVKIEFFRTGQQHRGQITFLIVFCGLNQRDFTLLFQIQIPEITE